MKKAYLIMTHKSPEQLYRLVERLNDGASEFFIHVDKKADIIPFERVKEFGDIIHFLDRYDLTWGRLGLIQPFLNGMRAVRNSSKKFDRILLLSGQDYPIKSNEAIDEFFKNSRHSVFVSYIPVPDYKKWPGKDRGGLFRFDKYFFGMKRHNLLCSKTLNLLSTYLPFLRRKIPNGMKPYIGQTWFNLDMYALNYILDFTEANPQFLNYHRHTFVADEVFIQMILCNSKDERLLKSIENSEKRFTIWEKSYSAHPNILRKSDFEAIKVSDDLFARKFDAEVDSEIFDLIDKHLLNWQVAGKHATQPEVH